MRPASAEDVGMAVDELVAEPGEHVGHRELAMLGGDLGVEEDLQQEVAELFANSADVAGLDGSRTS